MREGKNMERTTQVYIEGKIGILLLTERVGCGLEESGDDDENHCR
jgi:hypothetical protein